MKHSELRHQPRHVNPRIQVINKQRKGNKENFKYTDSSLTKRLKQRENFSFTHTMYLK